MLYQQLYKSYNIVVPNLASNSPHKQILNIIDTPEGTKLLKKKCRCSNENICPAYYIICFDFCWVHNKPIHPLASDFSSFILKPCISNSKFQSLDFFQLLQQANPLMPFTLLCKFPASLCTPQQPHSFQHKHTHIHTHLSLANLFPLLILFIIYHNLYII